MKTLVFAGTALILIVPLNLNCQTSQAERSQGHVAEQVSATSFRSLPEFQSQISIRLERHGCYGMCPIYNVTIFGNGRIVYEGKEFVRIKGRQKAAIARKTASDLVRRINEMQFFDVELAKMNTCLTDGATASVIASEPGRTREINDECVDSKELYELENAIDDAVEIQKWIFISHTELQRQIDRGWDIAVHGPEYATQAIEWDDGEVLKVLVKNGLPVDTRNRDGSTLLLRAVLAGRYKSAKALLEMGANPAARDFDGWSPPQNAGNRSVEMCKLFLEHGVGIDDQNGLGETMLMNASGTFPTHLDIVKFLLNSKANPNIRNQNGETAITIAKRMRQQFQQQIDSASDPRVASSLVAPTPPNLIQAMRDYEAIIDFLRLHGGKE